MGSSGTGRNDPRAVVSLPGQQGDVRYVLGPADLTGSIVQSASVAAPPGVTKATGTYVVKLTLTAAGSSAFNAVAARRYVSAANGTCPTSTYACLEAVDLDGIVVAAPAIETPRFDESIDLVGPGAEDYTLTNAQHLAAEINAAR